MTAHQASGTLKKRNKESAVRHEKTQMLCSIRADMRSGAWRVNNIFTFQALFMSLFSPSQHQKSTTI